MTCLPPQLTITWSGLYSRLLSRLNFAQIASRSAWVPGMGVYLVSPSSMACFPAALMLSGVSKSGSPAPRPMISRPTRFNSATLPVRTLVGDGFIRDRRCATMDMNLASAWFEIRRAQPTPPPIRRQQLTAPKFSVLTGNPVLSGVGLTLADIRKLWVVPQKWRRGVVLVTGFPFDSVVPGGSQRFLAHAYPIDTLTGITASPAPY